MAKDQEIERIDELKNIAHLSVARGKNNGKEYSWKPGDHDLFCSMMDAHIDITLRELSKQNEKFKESILTTVVLKVNELNNAFHAKMIADVAEIIKKQWPNALNESLKDYTKTRDRKLMRYVIVAGIIVLILAFIGMIGMLMYYHNNYIVTRIPKAIGTALSIFGL